MNSLSTKNSKAAGQSGKTHKQKQDDLGISKLRERLNLKSEHNIHFYEDIVETIRETLLVLDSDLRVLYANQRFYTSFKVTAKNTIGSLVYDLGNRQWDIPKLRKLLEEILPKKNRFNDYQIEHEFPTIGKRIMLLNARRITNLPGEQQMILLAIEDVTDRMLIEQALQVSEERFRAAFDTARDGVLLIDKISGKILNSNKAAQNLLGYPKKEMWKRYLWEMGFIRDTKQFRKVANQLEETGFFNFVDVIVKTKEGRAIPVDVYLTDRAKVIQCNFRDISERKKAELEIAESESKFKWLYINAPIAYHILTPDGIIMDVNRKWCQVLGYPKEEVLGKEIFDFIVEEERKAARASFIKKKADKGTFLEGSERNYLTKAGVVRTFKTYDFIVVDQSQNITSVQTTLEDITERKNVERAARLKAEQYTTMIATTTDGYWLVDSQGKILDVNETYCRMSGYTRSELLSLSITDLEDAEQPEKTAKHIQNIIKTGFDRFETYHKAKDGRVFHVEISVSFLKATKQMIVFVRDINERLQADKVLAESENKFRWLYEYAPIAYHILTSEGLIMDVNRKWCQVLGYPKEEVLGKEIFDFIVEEEREAAKISFKNKKTSKKSYVVGSERNYRTKNGVIKTFKTYDFLVLDQNQNVTSVQTTLEDITERKRMEQKLRENEQKLEEAQKLGRIGNWEFDLESQTIDWSDQVYKLYERDPALGPPGEKEEAAYYSSEQAKILRENAQQAAQHGRIIEYELTAQLPSGRSAIFAAKMQPVKNKDGQVVKLFGTVQDITERKIAEEALRESEERFRSLYENATIGIYRTTPDGHILLANPALVKMLGYQSFQELTNRNLNQEGFDLNYPRHEYQRRIEGEGIIHGFESIWKRKDGSTIHVRESAKVVRDKSGEVLYYEGTVEDISERHMAEKAMQESEERYRSLFEDSPVSLWEEDFSAVKQRLDALREQGVTDIRAYLESHPQEVADCAALIRVLDVNKATIELYRAKSKEALIKNLAQVISDDSTGYFIDELVSIAESQTQFSSEAVNQTLDDKQIEISLSWVAAPGHEGNLSKVLVSIVDITNRKQAEMEMRRLINDLRKLTELEKKNRVFAEALAKNVIALNSTLKTDDTLDSIIESINEVVPSNAVNIMLIEGDYARIVRSKGYQERGLDEWTRQKKFDLNEIKALREIIHSKKYIVTSNIDKSKYWTTIAETSWIKSNIISPIIEGETVIGFVNVDSPTPDFYTEENAKQLMAFTDQVSNALKNARLFEDTQRRINRMQAMTQIDQAINSSLDLNVSLEIVLIQAKDQLKADAVDILLVNDATSSLVFSKAKGFKTDEIRNANFRLGTGLPGKAVLERTLMAIPDLNAASESYFKNLLVEREGFVSYYCAPLITKGQLKGVMEVYFRQPFQSDQEWQEFLETLAQQTAIAINNAELLNSLRISNVELLNAYEATLKGWVDALDIRDKETEGHTLRVEEQSLQLARLMGIKDTEIINFHRGALLHDIGKVAISDTILNKPGPLTEEEWVIMRQHPLTAFQLLSKSKYLIPALDIPYCHHEKWDGSGYPRGLKGEEIPLTARIFAIVDVWDALTSDRPYRKAWTKKKALEYIQEQSGIHFDPKVVAAFQTMNHAGRK